MKFPVALLLLLGFIACKSPEKKPAGAADEGLDKRISQYFKANDEMDLKRVLDFTYPKLFEIAPRATLEKEMQAAFNNEEMTMELDSLTQVKQHPVFELGGGRYARIRYSMVMVMTLRDSSKIREQYPVLKESLGAEYGPGNFSIDEKTGVIRIRAEHDMVAIRDSYAKDWCFVGLEKNEELTKKIFSKEVLDKLSTYN